MESIKTRSVNTVVNTAAEIRKMLQLRQLRVLRVSSSSLVRVESRERVERESRERVERESVCVERE
jgi:hypothetical protein